jgi:hypothetical protein
MNTMTIHSQDVVIPDIVSYLDVALQETEVNGRLSQLIFQCETLPDLPILLVAGFEKARNMGYQDSGAAFGNCSGALLA